MRPADAVQEVLDQCQYPRPRDVTCEASKRGLLTMNRELTLTVDSYPGGHLTTRKKTVTEETYRGMGEVLWRQMALEMTR